MELVIGSPQPAEVPESQARSIKFQRQYHAWAKKISLTGFLPAGQISSSI
ncbi:hypothetical protein H0241_26635 [Mesorhizobium sp. CCANP35]|uniref:Uncharacterized protein n=2 Tax=Mesorhizobium neociceri TaxID=1307853 RepID=A0A838BE43_9HYPH|nr:hypothetical protein [Mesorhizobium neociceri]